MEVGVDPPEQVAGAGLDVRPERHADRPVRRHVAGRDVVTDDDRDAALDAFRARFGQRWGDEGRPADNLDGAGLVGGQGRVQCAGPRSTGQPRRAV